MNGYNDDQNEPKKKKKFRLFDSQREGKGVSKEQAANEGTGLKRFFRLYRDNFGKLFSVNIFNQFTDNKGFRMITPIG